MAHEESERSFDGQLQSAIKEGSIEDVLQVLHSSSESPFVMSGVYLGQAVRRFESEDSAWVIVADVMQIERPEVAARCLFEFEQRDAKRGVGVFDLVCAAYADAGNHSRLEKILMFLEELREEGEGGSDGGSGDREPRPPYEPRDADAMALEEPRAETQTESADHGGGVALLEHPDELDPDKE